MKAPIMNPKVTRLIIKILRSRSRISSKTVLEKSNRPWIN